MFTLEQRQAVQDWLIRTARADETVAGAAFTGSHATSSADRWSDTDLVLAVRGDLAATVERWTRWLYDEWDVRHHWDLASGPNLIRVFLLPGWLEIDLTFAPAEHFGPRGPQWRAIFGTAQAAEPFPAPDRNALAGHVWHHAWHAWICLQRGRHWQAEHWISALRGCAITLACVRLGLPSGYAKGAHLLPDEFTDSLDATLVRAVAEPELRRALAATVAVAVAELERLDAGLSARLGPMLTDLTAP